MITGALICEYNPFHKGHEYMLSKMREDGCDCIVAVMSGSFTQRGDVAIESKFSRAENALRGGADVVIELPSVWAVASAQRFAKGGTHIIKALHTIDRVYFGSESGCIETLKKAASATLNPDVNRRVRELMGDGEYYPSALQQAVGEVFGDEAALILATPNNTLGIEYIKCLLDTDIDIRTIKRTGACHDSMDVTSGIASASAIRERICAGEEYRNLLPCSNKEITNPAFTCYGDRAMLLALRSLTPEKLRELPDVTEGLENRIHDALRKHPDTETALEEIKTKRYTRARLRRILTCGLLGITKGHQSQDVPYVRILGFSTKGEDFIKSLKNTCTLPLIINVAKSESTLQGFAKECLENDIRATDIRTIFEKVPSGCSADYTRPIIKLNRE